MMCGTVYFLVSEIGLISEVGPQGQVLPAHAAHETLPVKDDVIHRTELLRVIHSRATPLAVLGPHCHVLVVEQ